MSDPIMLNVSKTVILQQYYGVNIDVIQGNVVRRATYGYNKGKNKAGNESSKCTIKPFDKHLYAIANCIQRILHVNRVQLKWNKCKYQTCI